MRCQAPPEQPELCVSVGTSINRVGLILIVAEVKVHSSICLPSMHTTGTGCVSAPPASLCPCMGVPCKAPGTASYPPSEAVARAAAGKAKQAAGSQLGSGFLSPAAWEE